VSGAGGRVYKSAEYGAHVSRGVQEGGCGEVGGGEACIVDGFERVAD
jgi:hypothetical protein